MDAIECLKTRRSVRKFLDQPVPWEMIAEIVDCARLSPSAGNLQAWKFIVVKDKESKKSIGEACVDQHWIAKAPYIIVVISEPEKVKRFYDTRGERLYAIQECGAAVENIMLAAHAQGLGSCWIGAFDEEKIKTVLNIPPEVRPQAIIPIGYAAEKPKKPEKLPLEIVTYLGGWRKKISDPDKVMGYYSPKVEAALKKGAEAVKNAPETIRKHGKKLAEHIKKKVAEKKA